MIYLFSRLTTHAGVLELADEVDSKSIDGNIVRVQVPPPAPTDSVGTQISGGGSDNPNLITRWWGSDFSLFTAP